MNETSRYVRAENDVPFVLRVIWFVLVGWHVMLWWVLIAWLLNMSIVGLPLGVWMLNRAPLVLTLKMPRTYSVAEVHQGQIVDRGYQGVPQHNWLLRLLYFVLIGWWLSLIWSLVGWLLCISIVGLPIGLWMLNRLPEVTSMMRQ